MIERFRVRRRLLDALLLQKLINDGEALAEAVADAVELREYAVGDTLIAQDGTDDHVYLLLAGGVDIGAG